MEKYIWPATVLLSVVILSATIWATFGGTGRYYFYTNNGFLIRGNTATGQIDGVDSSEGSCVLMPAD